MSRRLVMSVCAVLLAAGGTLASAGVASADIVDVSFGNGGSVSANFAGILDVFAGDCNGSNDAACGNIDISLF
ncbi:hypothetical protein OG373_41170 [Streptomyces avidinii]|uniref:hypothetical protein n=1 Tax=Streptomyces avidinii TaxID=1895 RepID=UPI0038682B4A|nr:hypothetical protein OG373_00005 [Streptomyces avidinii]WTB02262.1 hypothetical protein OG373_41170 [Streptomyces avidinii]